MARSRLHQ